MKKTAIIASAGIFAQLVASAADPYTVTEDFKGQTLEASNAVGAFLDTKDVGGSTEVLISGNEISGNSVSGSQISCGGLITLKNNVTVENAKFLDNSAYASGGSIYSGILELNNGFLSISGSEFSGNKAEVAAASGNFIVYGGVASIRGASSSAEVRDTVFDSNSASSTYRVQGGVLQVFNGGTLNIAGSSFTNNTAEAQNKARGAAVENYNANFSAADTLFENNSVKSTGLLGAYGGAFYSSEENAVSNFTDVVFKGNSANNGYGGAVSAEGGSTVNFIATKDAVFSGNYATNSSGEKQDSRGGFMHMSESAKANFNIADGATLTIGDGTAGYDSFAASSSSKASITKTGAGTLTVNGSMADYKASLTVSGGVMNVNNTLGASSIKVTNGASLNTGDIIQSYSGAYGSHRLNVANGSMKVNGDIVNTMNNVTSTGSVVVGLVGGNAVVTGTVKTVIDGEKTDISMLYGGNGGNQQTGYKPIGPSSVGAVDLTINNGHVFNIMGTGAMNSDVKGDVNIKVNGGTVDAIYATATGADVGGNVNVVINGGTIKGEAYGGTTLAIAAGGSQNTVTGAGVIHGSTNIVIGGDAVVGGDIYGGGWGDPDKILGGTNITIRDSATINGTIYGGGFGGATAIEGDRTLNVDNFTGSLSTADFDEIHVSGGDVIFENAFDVDSLFVSADAKVLLADGTSFDALAIEFDGTEFAEGQDFSFDLASIFADETIVESALNTGCGFTIVDAAGHQFSAEYSDGSIHVGTAVPEPAAFAAIFGAFALAFAAYRRKI